MDLTLGPRPSSDFSCSDTCLRTLPACKQWWMGWGGWGAGGGGGGGTEEWGTHVTVCTSGRRKGKCRRRRRRTGRSSTWMEVAKPEVQHTDQLHHWSTSTPGKKKHQIKVLLFLEEESGVPPPFHEILTEALGVLKGWTFHSTLWNCNTYEKCHFHSPFIACLRVSLTIVSLRKAVGFISCR